MRALAWPHSLNLSALLLGCWLVAGLSVEPVWAQDSTPGTDSTYVVQRGDTLFGIAQAHGVSVRALQAWNSMDDNALRVGQVLMVRPPKQPRTSPPPIDSAAVDPELAPGDAPTGPARYGTYTAEPGDTFYSIAARYGTAADTLFALNDSTTAALKPGQTVRLPERFAAPTHTVKPGDTLYGVAGQYGVSARALQDANDLDSSTIQVGQRLRIPGRTAAPPPPSRRDGLSAPDAEGPAVLFPDTYANRLTASGARYDPTELVVSHPDLPFGTVVLLTNPATDESTFARVIDRGPIDDQYVADVSPAVADVLDLEPESNQAVQLRVVSVPRDT